MQLRALAVAVVTVLLGTGARADTAADVRAVYQQFVTAQNAGDLQKVRSVLLDSPRFLWITDGMAVWGPDAALARMALFQQSEIWQVEPDPAKSQVIELGAVTAIFHLPLTLAIGAKAAGPDRLRFLVEVVCTRTAAGWRIAALLTTADKPG